MTVEKNRASLIVQKYGGSSLATPEQIHSAASQIADLHRRGHRLIVVVSAMGKTTDELIRLAYSVSPTPNRRELDMLLSTGERLSMSLLSMALNDRGVSAISLTGSQAGIFTDELHSNARIIDLKPIRVEAELARGHVVVLAGFQGVSPLTKEITTLGRGGSDTTAVAMAAHFQASRLEICKDVDGVHSADPHRVTQTVHLAHLHHRALLEMTFWGAKFLHYRSAELAARLHLPLEIRLAHPTHQTSPSKPISTRIDGEAMLYENAGILSVNSHADVRWLTVKAPNLDFAFSQVTVALRAANLPLPQFLDSELAAGGRCRMLITAPLETLNAIARIGAGDSSLTLDPQELATVTATCQGAYASALPGRIAHAVKDLSGTLYKLIFSAMSVSALIDRKDLESALEAIHSLRASLETER